MSNINQLPLWCRECEEPYTALDDDGVCDNCGTPNVLQRFSVPVTLSFDAYSYEEAVGQVTNLFNSLNIPLSISNEER